MSRFNNARLSQETEPFMKNPYNETFDELALIPPPGSNFMITEVGNLFMQLEGSTTLMITER